jgi:hypothetical protein
MGAAEPVSHKAELVMKVMEEDKSNGNFSMLMCAKINVKICISGRWGQDGRPLILV